MLITRFSLLFHFVAASFLPSQHSKATSSLPSISELLFPRTAGMFGKAAAREAAASRQGSLTGLGTAITFMRSDGLIIKIWILIWSLSEEVRHL